MAERLKKLAGHLNDKLPYTVANEQSEVEQKYGVPAGYLSATAAPIGPPAPAQPEDRPLVIVVTGCTSGLGQSLAREFARLGHTVVGCGRRTDRLTEMRGEFGTPHSFHECDVTDEASVMTLAASLREGPLDVVVSNSGVGQSGPVPWELSSEAFKKVIDVNLNGVFHVTRHLGAILAEQARLLDVGAPLKRLINMSSGVGHSTSHTACAYSASKWAVESLSKSTAQGIRASGLHGRMVCVPLAPGVVRSEMNSMPWAKPVEEWAPIAAQFILGITPEQSGTSLTLAKHGFYSEDYMATWAIPDGLPLPPRVEVPK